MDRLHGENQHWKITGAGGGGKGGGSVPTEEPDTLRSRAEASIVAALCEGEIAGFPTDDANSRGKFIFLDGTPLIGADGKSNFNTKGDKDVEVAFAKGTQSQQPLQGFSDVRIEQSIGAKVTKSTGVVSATTTRNDLSRIVVRIGIGSLFKVEDDGDIKAFKVNFNIKIVDALGEPIVDEDETIEGKSRGPFDREYFYQLSGTGPWTVRVKRKSGDPEDLQENNDLYFKAIVGILDDQLSYPNTALIGMKFAAESFTSVPRVSAELKGMLVRIPSGADANGVWNGSFSVAYSTNPAWILFDLMTNERYGAGQYINADDIDIYSLFEIAKYCDEGNRFTFNGIINNRGEAFDVLNSIAAAFRGMIYFAQGVIMATQDRPGTPVHQFSPANVVIEVDDRGQVTSPPFVYEGTALKARKTVAMVSWNDEDDDYKSKIEYVEDAAAIERYGYREIEVRALGTTNRAQARRIGFWTLQTNLNETETVTFKVGAEGFFVMPGEIIEIADPYRNPGIAAGALSAAGTNAVVLDRDVSFLEDTAYEIVIRDGDAERRAAVTNTPGSTSSVTISPSFTEIPDAGSPWIVRETSASSKLYRVIAIAEDNGIVTITATEYYEAKYGETDSLSLVSPQLAGVASSSLVGLPSVNPASINFAGT